MSFVSLKRKNVKTNDSNDQNISVRNISIDPKSLDDNKKFAEEIPEEFKYNNFREKRQFWNKASRDRGVSDRVSN